MAKRGRGTFVIKIKGKFPNLAKVPQEILVAAMPRVVEKVTAQAKENAPKGRGMGSSKSIVRRITGKVVKQGERGIVNARAPHSIWFERGVEPHSLAPGAGKKRWNKKRNPHKILKINGDPGIIRRGAWHPGFAARPFMEPAIEQSQSGVNRILQAEGDRAFEQAVINAVEDWGDALDKVVK